MTAPEAELRPDTDDPLRRASPAVDDMEARRARASVAGRLFSGPASRVHVGRYQVQGRIGSGGMGVVYRAHDPELARDVAVKLMNTDAVHGDDTRLARGRLVREARAMARLAHPNVIHVYDVGTVEDGVFIAMELVEGQPLADWIRTESHPWQEVLRQFVDAGRGLAAAHDAGVVHRDFKPENVLVGSDGRVRVGDFGLAGAPVADTGRHAAVGEIDTSTPGESGVRPVNEALTRTGTLLGTPKYMAPEQEGGVLANPLSDQFSFCVALYEGLYGYPPYEGTTVVRYRMAVRDGRLRPPPADSKVPGWVHEVIVRGLALRPSDRHPNMDALLDRLESALEDPRRGARRRWRSAILAAGVVGILGAAALGWALGRQPVDDEADASQQPAVVSRAPTPSEAAPPPRAEPDPPEPEALPAAESGEARAPRTTDSVKPPGAGRPLAAAEPETEAPPEAPAARTRPNAGGHTRSGSACYFTPDDRMYMTQRRHHSRHLTHSGQCYLCEEPPSGMKASLTPPDDVRCSRYYTCNPDPSEKSCGAASPH